MPPKGEDNEERKEENREEGREEGREEFEASSGEGAQDKEFSRPEKSQDWETRYKNLESEKGRLANEVGELRKAVESAKRESQAMQKIEELARKNPRAWKSLLNGDSEEAEPNEQLDKVKKLIQDGKGIEALRELTSIETKGLRAEVSNLQYQIRIEQAKAELARLETKFVITQEAKARAEEILRENPGVDAWHAVAAASKELDLELRKKTVEKKVDSGPGGVAKPEASEDKWKARAKRLGFLVPE